MGNVFSVVPLCRFFFSININPKYKLALLNSCRWVIAKGVSPSNTKTMRLLQGKLILSLTIVLSRSIFTVMKAGFVCFFFTSLIVFITCFEASLPNFATNIKPLKAN